MLGVWVTKFAHTHGYLMYFFHPFLCMLNLLPGVKPPHSQRELILVLLVVTG